MGVQILNKLKRAVIKEELVELTGDYKLAIVLNQFLYWTERVGAKRYNKWKEEETNRTTNNPNELDGGWIYKSASELVEEIMIGVSDSTARRYAKELIEQGYLMERDNPKYKWDNTKQYRVNLINIVNELDKLGYHLEGYKYDDLLQSPTTPNFQNEKSSFDSEDSSFENEKTIPEITAENTNPETTKKGVIKNNTTNKGVKQVYTYQQFKNEYNQDIYEDIDLAIQYYLNKYELTFNEEHPNLKWNQWDNIVEEMKVIEDPEYNRERWDIELYQWKEIINKHFDTRYRNCDYHLPHFISGEIIKNRFHEIGGVF